MGYRCRWCRSGWGTPRCGRRRRFTRTRYAAKTMRRRGGGMSFSAGEPGLAWNEKSSDDRRHPVPSLPIACPFGSSYWAISEATWTLPRDGNDIKQTMHSAPAFEIGPFDNMALAVRSEEHTSELQSLRHLVC